MNEDLALRIAWFRACDKAVDHPDVSSQLAALDHFSEPPIDPCADDFEPGQLWVPLDGSKHGFFTATDAERRCVGWAAKDLARITADPDGYVGDALERPSKNGERTRRAWEARGKRLEAEKEVHAAIWKACIEVLPRYSAKCRPASDEQHIEAAEMLIPVEVANYGK